MLLIPAFSWNYLGAIIIAIRYFPPSAANEVRRMTARRDSLSIAI